MWKPAYQAVKRLMFTMEPVKLIFSMPIKQTEALFLDVKLASQQIFGKNGHA